MYVHVTSRKYLHRFSLRTGSHVCNGSRWSYSGGPHEGRNRLLPFKEATTHLVQPRAVDDGVTVLGVRRRGALLPDRRRRRRRPRFGRGTPALLLDPRRAVRVDFVAHAVGTAHRQVGLRTLERKGRRRGEIEVHVRIMASHSFGPTVPYRAHVITQQFVLH